MQSYKNGTLNPEIVLAIAEKLTRKELKVYIKAIKLAEKRRSVTIAFASNITNDEQKQLQSLFPGKKLIVTQDPTLLAGIRITNNDDIFEMNLKHELDDIIQQIQNT